MNSQEGQRYVIVHAPLWGDVYAIAGLYRLISPKTQVVICFTVDELVDALVLHEHAPVVLGVCPHESIFLLSRVAHYLQPRRILFFARQFNYVDQQVPFYFLGNGVEFYAWKNKSMEDAQVALLDFVHSKKRAKAPIVIPEYLSQSPRILCAEALINNVNRYLYLSLSQWGVRAQSRRTLVMLARGWSTVKVAKTLGVNIKTVSSHKLFGLASLAVRMGGGDIYRGIIVKERLQRYMFWDDVERRGVSGYEDVSGSPDYFCGEETGGTIFRVENLVGDEIKSCSIR